VSGDTRIVIGALAIRRFRVLRALLWWSRWRYGGVEIKG
jgi:hypothetical protein